MITKVLVYFFIFYLLFIVSFNAITNMLPVYFEANSIHEDLWGYTYGLMVTFEVITLLVLNKLKKVNINFLLILSVALFVLRLIIYSIDISIYVKLAFTLLRGISYGIVLYCVTPLLKNIVGSNNLTKTYLFMMLLYGIMYFAFNNLSGIIIEKWGYNTLFITFILISMISFFFLILLIRKNKQDHNNLLTE